MYEDDTMDAKGGLEENGEDYEIPMMATGLDLQVTMTGVNDNYVK